MAAGNPHDRRRGSRARTPTDGMAVDVSYTGDILAEGRRAYPGFGLHRLEELLRDEFARGYQCGEGTMERYAEEKILPDAKRNAWEQGHAAGVTDGRDELLKAVAAEFEAKTIALRTGLSEFLEAIEPRANTGWPDAQSAAIMLIGQATELLGQMVAAHHAGFSEESF